MQKSVSTHVELLYQLALLSFEHTLVYQSFTQASHNSWVKSKRARCHGTKIVGPPLGKAIAFQTTDNYSLSTTKINRNDVGSNDCADAREISPGCQQAGRSKSNRARLSIAIHMLIGYGQQENYQLSRTTGLTFLFDVIGEVASILTWPGETMMEYQIPSGPYEKVRITFHQTIDITKIALSGLLQCGDRALSCCTKGSFVAMSLRIKTS